MGSRILLKWQTQMDDRLKNLIPWPEWENLQKTMPTCFLLLFSINAAIKIDWFEIFLDRLSHLWARAVIQITNTITLPKFVSNSPVSCCFWSETWGGFVTYNNLTKHCDILNKSLLGRRYGVLADQDLSLHNQLGLCKPACAYLQSQGKGPAFSNWGWGDQGICYCKKPCWVCYWIGLTKYMQVCRSWSYWRLYLIRFSLPHHVKGAHIACLHNWHLWTIPIDFVIIKVVEIFTWLTTLFVFVVLSVMYVIQ